MRKGKVFLAGIVTVIACQKKTEQVAGVGGLTEEQRGQVLAKVDDVSITVGEFSDRINKQSPYIRARYASLDRKKEFLQNLIRFEVLAKEASHRGFDKDPEVVRTMKQVMIQKLTKDIVDNGVKLTDISEDELKKYYDAHIEEYRKPEQVRASAVVVKDKKVADQVANEAKKNTQDQKLFRDLVTKHSTDEELKSRGGDLRYFGKDDTAVPKPVIGAAFSLAKIGDVSSPVKVDGGFYVVKLTGRRKELNRTFEEVKRQIQNRLYRDKRTQALEDFVTNLKNKAKVEIYEDKLAAVAIDTSTPTPGEGPPGLVGDPAEGGGPPVGGPLRLGPSPAAPGTTPQ